MPRWGNVLAGFVRCCKKNQGFVERKEEERKRVALGESISRGEELAEYLVRQNEVYAARFVGYLT